MSYTEPAPRKKRLFFVTIGFSKGPLDNAVWSGWRWAQESSDACHLAITEIGTTLEKTWYERAVSGDEFAEYELASPPVDAKEEKKQ